MVALSVIIPAYQEEDNLRTILPRLNTVLGSLRIDYEVLVIDTIRPLDNTKKVCQDNNARYINRESGNYFGDAIRTGIRLAVGEYIIFMDGDGSHAPEFIPELWQHKDNYDIAIASRYTKGGSTENNKIALLMSLAVNKIYSLVLGLNCHDVSNNFKLYRKALLENLELYSNNFEIVEEILFKIKKAHHKDLRLIEVPAVFKKRVYGATKRNLILFMFSYLFTLIKLRFRK